MSTSGQHPQHQMVEVPLGNDNFGVILDDEQDNNDDVFEKTQITEIEAYKSEKTRSGSESSGGGKSVLFNVNGTHLEKVEEAAETESDDPSSGATLLYKITDNPPIYLTVLFGLQQCLLSIVGNLVTPFLVAGAVCGEDDDLLITRLLSTTMFLSGITTLVQVIFGIRLPLYQGPAAAFIIPLLTLKSQNPDQCNPAAVFPDKYINGSLIGNVTEKDVLNDLVLLRSQEIMGPLMICGTIQFLFGFTGAVGYLLRFVGPITIIPTLILIGLSITDATLEYVEAQWGVTILTWAVSVILSLYFGSKPMPIPMYSRKKGWYIIRYPLHQVLAILISIIVGWIVCGILTSAGALSDDPTSIQYKARTDARADSITNSEWAYFPYPGQFGAPRFAVGPFIAFIIATLTSILDSIGDYYACANICKVPTPPGHAVNRGIAVEGFCSIISGIMGAGHATTTYGGNIGAIGMTKVASRSVFIAMGIIYLVLGILTKVSAVFVSIPNPVLGGTMLTIIGVFIGVNLSNLQVVDLSSTRNLSIIGMGIFIGYLVPTWVAENPDLEFASNAKVDEVIRSFLGNPNFVGTVLSCFLDNTVPGTLEERGVAAWREDSPGGDASADNQAQTVEFLEGPEVYDPLVPASCKMSKIFKYLPIFPYESNTKESKYDLDRRRSTVPSIEVYGVPDDYRRRQSIRKDSDLYIRRSSSLSMRRKSVLSSF